jgi:hypothetical protein
MNDKFTVTRKDGRSNTQVVCDLVATQNAGYVLGYDDLMKALSEGASRTFTRRDVQSAVRVAGPKLGKLHRRALQNAKNTGYRIALATDHMGLALTKKSEAMRKLKRGCQLLMDVRLEEIKDPEARKAHEGQALILQGQFYMLSAHERRLNRVEELIARMFHGQPPQ